MRKKNIKIEISNEILQIIRLVQRKYILRAIIFLVITVVPVIVARLLNPPKFIRLSMVIVVAVSILGLSYNTILLFVSITKPLYYKTTIEKLLVTDIHQSLAQREKVLLQQEGQTIIKTTLLNSIMVVCCFDISEDTAASNFSEEILQVKKKQKQNRKIGYIVIFNVKCSTFNIKKFMKQQSLDNRALCDIRCFYFADDQELIAVYDKKTDFCKQVVSKVIALLNNDSTIGSTTV